MGAPWLDTPVGWHSSRERSSGHHGDMTPEEAALIQKQFRNWYTADLDFSLPTVYFFCGAIGLLFLLNTFLRVRSRAKAGKSDIHGVSIVDRIVALSRWFTSKQYSIRSIPLVGTWYSPSVGVVLGIATMWTFILALTLGPRPYYWPNPAMGHSMPIATRTGWISIAIMPFMIAFATKVNWVGILTGTSHEKLQVWHRWAALIMYITSLVHTFPFIVKSIQNGEMETNWKTSSFYWTGVAALVPQTWLCGLSWGIFRNPYYETFKKFHFIAATIFMVALFLHVNWMLTSWDYFWATMGLYVTAWLFRVLRTLYNSSLGCSAELSLLPDNMLNVRIHIPPRVKWSPGQHVFLRFFGGGVGIHFFSSHPFTIASLHFGPENTKDGEGVKERRTLNIVSKVHGGITGVLAKLAEEDGGNVRVFVDGPYGGIPRGLDLKNYDGALLLAGGTGSTFILPIFSDLVSSIAPGIPWKRIELVIAIRDSESLSWIEPCLSRAKSLANSVELSINVHITGSSHSKVDKDNSSTSDKSIEGERTANMETQNGRPNLPLVVKSFINSSSGRVAIAACGPDSFLYDLRNTVAECQLALVDGVAGPREIFLHTENYGW